MMTGPQVWMGLAGAFIIHDTEEAALHLPSDDGEIPLLLRDATLDTEGNLLYTHTPGEFPLVNGRRDPVFYVDTDVYRLRVLNGANARVFRLAFNTGASLFLIGNDGGLLQTAAQVTQCDLGPGERLDLLLDFRQKPTGSSVTLQCLSAAWNLVKFVVRRQTVPRYSLPTGTLSTITPLSNPVVTRTFAFQGTSRINGLVYDMDRIDFQVPFGQTERWSFSSTSGGPHPVHVHGASFQVQSRTGGRGMVYPGERGWKDTVLVATGETVEVLIRFNHYRGVYLLHCHNLEHEDMGMMSNFEVV
jgi:FtsP/CotA-like multicopper oxidase with cupredoxin domain